ncbi:hypothetical protein BG011_000030 [Mortierella polycephala]|uniref:F-box domain-containing protein n=1 Tax=Mortierella polycephala TaxID=41804 RepID=A0A9P6UBM8_9FUNG|nr:hypothetical protein BG011_000030 [Mortierella polycephala]
MGQNRSPLNLPEIATLVAQHLEKKDLAGCILVNKTWHALFVPFLWETITLKDSRYYGFAIPEIVLQRRAYVRSLVYNVNSTEPQVIEALQFPNLKSLIIHTFARELEGIAIKLLSQNPTIDWINIHSRYCILSTEFWTQLLNFQGLKTLMIDAIQVQKSSGPQFYSVCSHVSSLHLRCRYLPWMRSWSSLPRFAIRKLVLLGCGWSMNEHIELIAQCHDLEELRWIESHTRGSGGSVPWNTIQRLASAGTWPRLERLHLPAACIPDMELATILESMASVVELGVDSTNFGQHSFEALRPHLSTIEKLDLRGCRGLTPDIMTEILYTAVKMRDRDFLWDIDLTWTIG